MVFEENRILADDGKWLTNGDTVGKVVHLGINDSADNWHEITDEEYMALQEVGDTDG